MTLSTSRLAYTDCIEVFDRALEDSKGIRISQPGIDEANHFRMRMHQARKLIRDDNRLTYEDDHPMFGRSVYDKLAVRIKNIEGTIYLYIQPYVTPTNIESLSELEEADGVSEDRSGESNTGAIPELLEESVGVGDRVRSEDRREARDSELPVRSPEGQRRV